MTKAIEIFPLETVVWLRHPKKTDGNCQHWQSPPRFILERASACTTSWRIGDVGTVDE